MDLMHITSFHLHIFEFAGAITINIKYLIAKLFESIYLLYSAFMSSCIIIMFSNWACN